MEFNKKFIKSGMKLNNDEAKENILNFFKWANDEKVKFNFITEIEYYNDTEDTIVFNELKNVTLQETCVGIKFASIDNKIHCSKDLVLDVLDKECTFYYHSDSVKIDLIGEKTSIALYFYW